MTVCVCVCGTGLFGEQIGEKNARTEALMHSPPTVFIASVNQSVSRKIFCKKNIFNKKV